MDQLINLVSSSKWSLFLDRDGVINRRIPDDYVKLPEQFEFIPGVLEAFGIFNKLFDHIVIVTNQQGIGRGLMTSKELGLVHEKMLEQIIKSNGRVDAIYFSPDLKNTGSFTRKPAVGLGLKARKEFPEIRFRKSIMAGDTFSDMLFGKRLDMVNVLINNNPEEIKACRELPDYLFPDLISFAKSLNTSEVRSKK
jgi:D-glycero-D-manno-heptose 1,7-bisphosphate phosphatase